MPRPRRLVLIAITVLCAGCAYGDNGITIPRFQQPSSASQSMSISPATATLKVGQTVTLTRKGLGATFWSTTDGTVAIVSQAGVVKGIAAGSVVILASSPGGVAGAGITVTP